MNIQHSTPPSRPFGALFIRLLSLALALLLMSCGGGSGSPAAPLSLSLFAGNPDGIGSLDGSARVASFYNPYAVATDAGGNVYVADSYNHTIRKISAQGVVTTLAGKTGSAGSEDGVGADARFYSPNGVATDNVGNLYVTDTFNYTIRKITADGVVTTLAGTVGVTGSADRPTSTAAPASFNTPRGIAADASGNLYVADSSNHLIRKITPDGVVSTLAGTAGVSGRTDGTGTSAKFYRPYALSTDTIGNVYVADSFNHIIRKITPDGVVTTVAGTPGSFGTTDRLTPTAPPARFFLPRGIAADVSGNVYVADSGNHSIRKITPDGLVTTLAGTVGLTGSADRLSTTDPAASFNIPMGLATDVGGNVYVADLTNQTIRKITVAGVVTTLAGTAGLRGGDDGSGAAARFYAPNYLATDTQGNLYVTDYKNHTIRKITPSGVVSTVAGVAGSTGSADGSSADARFNLPSGIAIDAVGNLYVTDQLNHTIRKITPEGTVSTLAGTVGVAGSADRLSVDAPAASFNQPYGVAIDTVGNLYVTEWGNHTIRKITRDGLVSTLAGSAGLSGSDNGTGSIARFNIPSGVTTDAMGNLYVAEQGNSTIRKVTAQGVVTTLAGVAGDNGRADGPGTVARFSGPDGLASDTSGNLYVADQRNHTIRKITPGGDVSTLAGTAGVPGFSPGALPGHIAQPFGIAVTQSRIYFTTNNAIGVIQ